MAKMEFKNKTLEKLFRGYKWSRNNSIQMLNIAIESNILDYKPRDGKFNFQPVLHQFQCLASTADTYYRQLLKADNQKFGIIIFEGKPINKGDISQKNLPVILKTQLEKLEEVFRDFSEEDFEENVKAIQSMFNHEYLHQGELIVLMREADIDLPERFRKAFAL